MWSHARIVRLVVQKLDVAIKRPYKPLANNLHCRMPIVTTKLASSD